MNLVTSPEIRDTKGIVGVFDQTGYLYWVLNCLGDNLTLAFSLESLSCMPYIECKYVSFQALKLSHHDLSYMWKLVMVATGIYVFFLLECVMKMYLYFKSLEVRFYVLDIF